MVADLNEFLAKVDTHNEMYGKLMNFNSAYRHREHRLLFSSFCKTKFSGGHWRQQVLGLLNPQFPSSIFFKQTRNEQRESQGVENLQQRTIVGFGDAIFKSIKK